ncbi:MAG: hypothetical protein GY794_25500, partial [bacterium]|nr:hypothetical protein [bacterium]
VKSLLFPASDSPTRATTKTGIMDVIKPAVDISSILNSTPSGGGNAAEHYAKAIELFFDNYKAIENAALDLGKGNAENYPEALKTLKTIRNLIATGAKQASMDYMTKYTSGKLQVSTRQKDINRLAQTLVIIDILGDYHIENKRFKEADAIFRDMFIAGWHMINERSHIQATMHGEDVQGTALKGMIRTLKKNTNINDVAKKKRKATLKNYNYSLIEFRYEHEDKEKIFRKLRSDGTFNAGDVWNIAENDKDRAWRVQAILTMGVLKFTHSGSRGNNARNNELIEKFLKSDDPLEKAAAEAAKAYTEIEFNQISSKW